MSEPDLSKAFLEVVQAPASGPQAGQLLPLAASTTTIGRVPGNTHVLKDSTISRQHAKVFVRDGRHWLADLNSSHGTFVNGAKVTLHTLGDGDEVKLGSTVLRYRSAAPAAKPSTPPPAAPSAKPSGPMHPADMGTGSFELELPESGEPPSPATHGPLPPIATGYRRALTETGEDPFAEEQKPPSNGGVRESAPAIEMRGETARQFALRGSAAPASAAPASAAAPAARGAPPITAAPRSRGPFSFVRDELDQRGPAARAVATLFALAVAAGLFWLALRVFEAVPKSEPETPSDETAPQGPQGPQLPKRR